MTREMTTIDLIQLLRRERVKRSSWLPVWEDLARSHYRNLRSQWLVKNNKTLDDWRVLESSVQMSMWQSGNYAEEWLKFAYCNVEVEQ